MANEEHLAILKKGVVIWNKWRKENPGIRPDLRGADLRLSDLFRANLRKTYLVGTNLFGANLIGADLRKADLRGADFSEAQFLAAKLAGAKAHLTKFANIDLSMAVGLEDMKHQGPSTIGIDTIYRSNGKIPEVFLSGAGVPANFILYMHSLTSEALQFYSCFISYSSKDQKFAERLHADLQTKGVRCWFAPEDLKIGDELRPTFDEAIRVRDKVLLILSENSIRSPWVKREVERALDDEMRRQKQRNDYTVLFPVRLDNDIFDLAKGWATDVQRRHIGDFTNWKDHDSYQKAFDRLLRDLEMEKKMP
jgi:hypothetical protein